MKRTWIAALFLGAVFACSGDPDPIVVSVGDEAIRADEFRYLFSEALRSDSTLATDVAGLQKFAESRVEDLLYANLFRESGGELEAARADRLLDFRERRMIEHLRTVEYGSAYEVTDKELRQAYGKLETRRHLRRITVPTETQAREIRRAVREGALFDRVAMQVSLDERTKAVGGELGWLVYTDLPAFDRDPVFTLGEGEITEPLPAGTLYQLYQVVAIDENLSRGTLEEERPVLEQGLIMLKVTQAKKAYEDRLFEAARFKLNPAEVAWMTVHMREKTAGAIRGQDVLNDETMEERDGYLLSRGRIPWTGPPVAPADTARVLATYDPDGEVKPLLVFDQLVSSPIPTWPTFGRSADVEELIHELVLERLEQEEAYRRGYDQDPAVLYEVRARERDIVRRQYIRNQIRRPLIPDEAEIRAEYERRIDEFTSPEARRFLAVNLSSWSAAKRASEMLREGVPLAEIESRFEPGDSLQSTGPNGTPPVAFGQAPALDDVLFSLGLGEVSDPIAVGSTFTVAKVIEIIPEEVEPFDDVRIDVQVAMVDAKADAEEEMILAAARERFPVMIDTEALRGLDLD